MVTSYFIWGKNDAVGVLTNLLPASVAFYNLVMDIKAGARVPMPDIGLLQGAAEAGGRAGRCAAAAMAQTSPRVAGTPTRAADAGLRARHAATADSRAATCCGWRWRCSSSSAPASAFAIPGRRMSRASRPSHATWSPRGEWLFPRVGGDLYQDKPPLFFWMLAVCYSLTRLAQVVVPDSVISGGGRHPVPDLRPRPAAGEPRSGPRGRHGHGVARCTSRW